MDECPLGNTSSFQAYWTTAPGADLDPRQPPTPHPCRCRHALGPPGGRHAAAQHAAGAPGRRHAVVGRSDHAGRPGRRLATHPAHWRRGVGCGGRSDGHRAGHHRPAPAPLPRQREPDRDAGIGLHRGVGDRGAGMAGRGPRLAVPLPVRGAAAVRPRGAQPAPAAHVPRGPRACHVRSPGLRRRQRRGGGGDRRPAGDAALRGGGRAGAVPDPPPPERRTERSA